MRRTIVAAGSFALLLGSATAANALPEGSDPPDHVVVATGLDNPRQLAWSGRGILVAEAGQGGADCAPAAAAEAPPADAPVVETPVVETPVVETPVVETPPTTTDDDGTADQGSGDTPVAPDATTGTDATTPSDDDGTADQGSGDAGTTADATDDDGTADQGPGDAAAAADPSAAAAEAAVCDGPTGSISAIERPSRTEEGEAEPVVEGLYSVESPEGAVGPDGVAATGTPGVLLIAQGELTPDALAGTGGTDGAETQEQLLVSVDGEAVPWVDLGEYESDEDPDGNGIADSNPNAVIVVDPEDRRGRDDDGDDDRDGDEYALVADAGANAVWKVTADFDDLGEDDLPDSEVSVFAAFPAEEGQPQFVPSALAQDEDGNIYVGGVGGLAPGAAEVVRYDADGDETGRWGGFTGINGLTVAPDGEHVYVSQVFGSEGPAGAGTGSVVRFETDDSGDATYAQVDIPFPAGLLLGRNDTVYVSAYSLSTADAADDEDGQVWRFTFPEDAEELPLPVVTEPATSAPTEPAPTTPDDGTATGDDTVVPGDDDGTADQGSGDAGTATPPIGDDTVVPGDDDGTPAPSRRAPRL
jgi:hypothetical protein